MVDVHAHVQHSWDEFLDIKQAVMQRFFEIKVAADFQGKGSKKLVFINWHWTPSFLSHLPGASKWDGFSPRYGTLANEGIAYSRHFQLA